MKVWGKALWLCVSLLSVNVSAKQLTHQFSEHVTLQGELTQGSLIKGQAPAGSKVYFDQQLLQVSPEGKFVFGIGRDAPLDHSLVIEHDGKALTLPLQFTKREYDIQHVNGVAQKYVSPPNDVIARIAHDNKKVKEVRETQSALTYIFSPPVRPATGRISGVYGSQRVFNGEPRNPHYGLDIAAPTGSTVFAPWSGKVLLADDLYYSGMTLIIDHGFGVTSTMLHLSKFHVTVGDEVTQGQKIAEIGATGRVTGPHLDWRINWQHERLDPALLLTEQQLSQSDNPKTLKQH